MKAVVYTEYGPPEVLHLTDIAKPAPKDNEIGIHVHATSVNYGDLLARNFKNVSPSEFNMPLPFYFGARLFFGLSKPKMSVLGSEFAGEVEAVGGSVTRFKVGDKVFGYLGQPMGAYAEYVCMAEDKMVAHKPTNMTDEEATSVPMGAFTALNVLRKVNLQPGQKILINGASGSIGSHAVQLAKHYGAEVTGVCGTPRMDMVKALGADHVIDYKHEDFTQNGETYDVILDVLGKSSFARCKNSLKPNGVYLLSSFKMKQLVQMLWTSLVGSQKVICALASEKTEDLIAIKELIETGAIKSIVDKSFPLEQAAEAHRYAESGQKTGNVIITVAQNDNV